MTRKDTPAASTAPTAAPGAASVPAKQTKLAAAMASVTSNVTAIEALGARIDELERTAPKNRAFDLTTKEGEKECDGVRKSAREARLEVQNLRKDGTSLLNGLKNELWAVADPQLERLQAIEDNAKGQLEAKANAEAARKARHEANMQAIANLTAGLDAGTASAVITQRMTACEAIVVDESYEEYQQKAERKLRDARDTLTAAFAAAMSREASERAEAERRAALEAELAAAREKEQRQARARERIQTIKALPEQVSGTGAENIRRILAQHELSVPDALHYGDLLEFAELAHESATMKMRALLAEAVAAEAPTSGVLFSGFAHADDDGPEVLAPQEEARPVPPARSVAAQQALSTPDTDGDPFTRPIPKPAPVMRAPIPRVSPPAPVAPDPREGMDVTEGEAPDLFASAKAFIAAVERVHAGRPAPYIMPVEWLTAFNELRAAVDFISEFAD